MTSLQETPAALTDDEITAFIEDPAKIETHEVALEVIAVLDAEIANIQVQVDAAMIEANIRPLSDERQAWLRRASYAGAMRRNERHRVMQRDREIRRVKGVAQMEPRRSKEEKLLRQQRLLVEGEARREQKRAEGLRQSNLQSELSLKRKELDAARSFERRFLATAKRLLQPDVYSWIEDEASGRPPATSADIAAELGCETEPVPTTTPTPIAGER